MGHFGFLDKISYASPAPAADVMFVNTFVPRESLAALCINTDYLSLQKETISAFQARIFTLNLTEPKFNNFLDSSINNIGYPTIVLIQRGSYQIEVLGHIRTSALLLLVQSRNSL